LALTGTLVYLGASRFWGPARGCIVLVLWITYPLNLFFCSYPSAEVPFEVLLYGGLLLFAWGVTSERGRWFQFALCGLLVGCSMLIRPIALLLSFALALCLWVLKADLCARGRLALVAVLLASTCLTVLPWEIWVYRNTRQVVLLGSLGVAALKSGLTFGASGKKFHSGVSLPRDVRQVMEEINSQSNKVRTYSDVGVVLAEQARKRPVALVKLFVIKAARSWYGTDSQRWEGALALVQAPYLVLALAASLRAWRARGRLRQLAVVVWIVVIYFWAMNILSATIARYSVPSMALLFMLVPALWQGLARSEVQGRPYAEDKAPLAV
jgi:hypothetical protein